jgi:hypothetical protein
MAGNGNFQTSFVTALHAKFQEYLAQGLGANTMSETGMTSKERVSLQFVKNA